MSNNYKKAVDEIVMSDELKNKILEKATAVPEKKKAPFVISARYMAVAACIALCAVFAVFVSGRMSYNDIKIQEADEPKPPIEQPVKTEVPLLSDDTQKEEAVPEVKENSKIKSAQKKETPEIENDTVDVAKTEEITTYNAEIEVAEESIVAEEAVSGGGASMARIMPEEEEPTEESVEAEVEEAVEETADVPAAVYNPMNKVEGVGKIEEELGYSIKTPQFANGWYEIDSCYVIGGEVAEINYAGASGKITYRTKMGLYDISGDYNVYDTQEEIKVNGMTVTVKGAGGQLNRADWTDDKYSYSIGCENGIDLKEAIAIIESIR